jgi:hypothetical protein
MEKRGWRRRLSPQGGHKRLNSPGASYRDTTGAALSLLEEQGKQEVGHAKPTHSRRFLRRSESEDEPSGTQDLHEAAASDDLQLLQFATRRRCSRARFLHLEPSIAVHGKLEGVASGRGRCCDLVGVASPE